jgi:hypothetical protein
VTTAGLAANLHNGLFHKESKRDQEERSTRHPERTQAVEPSALRQLLRSRTRRPTFQTPPVEAVDLVCREHDRCYGLLGDFDERCDRNLVEMMPNAIAITPTPLGKQVGLLTMLYFSTLERNLGLGETLFKGN